jgi:DNA adenine methylase
VKMAAPLKWHGGKAYLALKIVDLMPPRCKNPNQPADDDPGWLHYVEPYFGGGAVLLANDPEGISEVVNDLNAELTNFWRVLQDKVAFAQFHREIEAVPFSQNEFECGEITKHAIERDPVDCAVRFFIRCRQSLAGRMKGFTGITKTRTRRGMSNEVSAWLSCVEGLPAVHARLKRVLILNRPALDVIREQDGPRTLFYLDPPYLHETRATTGEYQHEMSREDHSLLLQLLAGIQGRFLLSGYHSDLYDTEAAALGWKCHEFKIANHAAGGKEKRRMIECVWCNFE